MVGRLEKSLYGTRDAALNWAETCAKVLMAMGYEEGASSSCGFYHREWEFRTVVHGDDFLTEGGVKSCKKMDDALRKEFMVKMEIIGPDAGQTRQGRVFNRVITWEEGGIAWEPDPRHVETLLKQMGLEDGKSLSIPGAKPTFSKKKSEEADVDEVGDPKSEHWKIKFGTC